MSYREIVTHRSDVNNPAGSPRVFAVSEPTAANAVNLYEVILTDSDLSEPGTTSEDDIIVVPFQDGPVPAVGINGGTLESYLAICADRLEGFQAGKFPCDENAEALKHINAAIEALHSRTRARQARGVEGQLTA